MSDPNGGAPQTATQEGSVTPALEHPSGDRATEGVPLPRWERYELGPLLGRGGMGEVYQAKDRRLGRTVALKLVRGADPERVMRFLQEAKAQARIDHPHVCKVYEVGHVDGRDYIAMQFIGGSRLDTAARGMSLPEKVQVMREVAAAMHEAHRLGVIHRDLKPANILVERHEDGRLFPVVTDFGLAHEAGFEHGLTRSGAVLGTPAYMAPEQARGDTRAIDRRSDVYGLGATLYELLTGAPPFSDATVLGTLNKVLHEDPVPPRSRVPHLPSDLETLVLKCLSKDPDGRYASARALAEDLGRYMDGEPILGRRTPLLERLRRKARKHRALVAVSAVSLVSILVLSGVGARSWLQARATQRQSEGRARLAGQLGQQVKDLEWLLRAATLAPPHDTTREQGLVREHMARLSAQPHGLGPQGDALVHYALGRGHLALQELDRAHEALTRARELGLDSPELHHALGRVLGELYRRALEHARRSGGPAWVASRQRELEARYLQPALGALERSRGQELESPELLEGLIALYRGQHDEAARAATLAMERAPWLFEPRKLAGDVAQARALAQLERGEYDAARTGFAEAERLYGKAAELGRSDARAYEALAETWLQVSELDRRQGRSRKAALEKALAAVDGALQVAPSRAAAWEKKAFVLRNWYRVMNFQGGGLDPKPILAQVLATAARAVELDPGGVQALDTLGYGHFLQGLQEAREGKDPNPSWTQATVHLGRALERQARYPWGLNDLALVHRWRGNWQREHGQDPGPAWDEAERSFRLAVETDPQYLFAQSNLAELYTARAAHAVSQGVDPEPDVQRALEAGARALAIDAHFHSALNHQALAELLRAEHLVNTGTDPRPAVERAFGYLQRAQAINAAFPRTHYHRALGKLLLARHALRTGGDAEAPLQGGREAVVQALRGDPRCADCRVLGARLDLTEADGARKAGRSPLPLLQRAREEARRAVETYPYDESHQALAWACWQLAEALPRGEASAAVTEGLAQVEQALRLNPRLAQAHAIQGRLLLLRARTQ